MFLQANPNLNLKAKVTDPIPGMIVAINMYLQAYHMYRAEALSTPEVRRLIADFADSVQVCIVRQMHTFQKKCAFSMHQVCKKCAECARVLHQVCISTRVFPGKIPGLIILQT